MSSADPETARAPSAAEPATQAIHARLRPEHVRALRLGHGANCSSVGSVIDTLFLSAVAGGAIFAAVCAALEDAPPMNTDADESNRDAARVVSPPSPPEAKP